MRLSHPTDTVRVPVSSRPIVWAVVADAALRDIIQREPAGAADFPDPCNHLQLPPNQLGFSSVLQFLRCGKGSGELEEGAPMPRRTQGRLLVERSIDRTGTPAQRSDGRLRRSVTVNIAESPLGWLFARGFVSQRQFDAGERLRCDWERAQLSPRVTMAWDLGPVAQSRGGAGNQIRI